MRSASNRHDLRHPRASRQVLNGTPLHVLQALGGRGCFSMVQLQAHRSAVHLAGYAGNVSRIHAVTGTLSGTPAVETSDSSTRETA